METAAGSPANTTDIAVRLLLGVARLGENDLRGWWNGHALDRTGRYVLSSMFRRTWRPAALEVDIAAAGEMHAQLLGRSTALHLFSDLLPFKRLATGWLAEQKTAVESDSLLGLLEAWTEEEATDSVRSWCGNPEPVRGEQLGEGLRLGRLSASDIKDAAALNQRARVLAFSYLDQTGPLRPPYFDLTR